MTDQTDQWYFEIGDGHTYGPFPLEKLQKWAAVGNLMPTHRVRKVGADEWTIAAYVPGLELTTAATVGAVLPKEDVDQRPSRSKTLAATVRGLGRKAKPNAGDDSPGAGQTADGKSKAPAEPPDIVGICNEMLETAFQRGASDLHIDPEQNIVLIHLRVDGELEPLRKLPKAIHPPVVSRFKVLAGMDIAERRMAQDGHFAQHMGPQKQLTHFCAATLPTTHGERMTLRLLAVETEQLTLHRLGMSEQDLRTFAAHTGQKQGMILLSGPTGSGKSTTLYAALRHRLAHHWGRIITVEDPVEFDIVGVAQVEVDSAEKVRIDTVLRNILRSDPDVIMIGEIRDFGSADVAIKAALTGHLVFSSLHTNSAVGVITRLIDMGLEPFQVAATLRLCIAQRLVRRLCIECRRPGKLSETDAAKIGRPAIAGSTVYEPAGCKSCNERGYRGRIGIFEMLPIDDELARKIVDGCDEGQIWRHAAKRKVARLHEDGIQKLLAGLTSVDELFAISAG